MGFLERLGLRRTVERGSPGTSVVFPPESAYRNNWWQLGRTPTSDRQALQSSAVYACVSVISQEIARLHVRHWRRLPNGGREELRDTPAARVMRRPNPYQSRSDFWLNYISSVLINGNAYALAQRDGAGRIMALHPRVANAVQAKVDDRTGAVFYYVSTSRLEPGQPTQVPARNIMHMRLFCPTDPLVGLSPLQAASYSISHAEQLQRQQVSFWGNKARPSGVLQTDRPLSDAASKRLRDQWGAGSSGDGIGKTAVLDSGIKWQPLGLSAADTQLIEQFNLTVDDVARVFRVPLFMLNRLEQSSYNNVETMGRVFISQCLGFYLEAAEATLDRTFNLPSTEYLEFDHERGLLRTNTDLRMKAHRDAIQGGIKSPNECRLEEQLPPVPGGDDVFLQSQMIPVETAAEAEPTPEPQPVAPSVVEPDPDDEDESERVAALEVELARQRMDYASQLGALEQDLATARAREASE